MFSPATEQLADKMSTAILNQHDPIIVKQGAPAYLILIDSLINEEPEQQELLLSGANLYNAYATIFVENKTRAQRLTDKSWAYSRQALCISYAAGCLIHRQPYHEFVAFLATLDYSDIATLYSYASSWASWVQSHADDMSARADLPKVEAAMKRVVELDNNYLQGRPLLYLSVLSIILPPALGGRPKQALSYFKQALNLSNKRNLMFKVIFAESYARMLFDRELHDRLLREVIAADPIAPDLTLINTIAQEKALVLLNNADDYF